MKKMLIAMLLLCVSVVNAVELQDACSSRGLQYASGWIYDGTYVNTYDIGYDVNVTGTARKLNWTSNEYIDGVVYKSGNRTYLIEGGYNGTIPKTTLSNDFVFVAFCVNDVQIPEFGVVGAVLVLLVGVGVVLFRRK